MILFTLSKVLLIAVISAYFASIVLSQADENSFN